MTNNNITLDDIHKSSFLDIVFPQDISYGAQGGPTFTTRIVTSSSGYEYRNCNWEYPLGQYNVAHGVRTKKQMRDLISFFRICKGRAYAFRFRDWSDYQVQGQQIALSDGSTRIFPLVAEYSFGGLKVQRRITRPVQGSVKIYIGNQTNPIAINYTVNYHNGIVELSQAISKNTSIFADFLFDVPARFGMDQLQATIEGPEAISWKNIIITEIKE